MRAVGGRVDDPLAPYRTITRRRSDGRAWVLANMVTGLDGTAAVGGNVAALSTPRDSQLFHRLRGLADAVLVGAQTVRQERYGPVVLDDDLVRARRASGRNLPRLVIVSSTLELDPNLPVFTGAQPGQGPIVVTTARSDHARLASVPVEIIVAGDDRVDMRTAIDALTERSLDVVLCEGGPTLLGELIGADLLDEYCLTVSPLVGGDPLPIVNTSVLSGLTRFRLNHVYADEDTLFLNYLRDRRSFP